MSRRLALPGLLEMTYFLGGVISVLAMGYLVGGIGLEQRADRDFHACMDSARDPVDTNRRDPGGCRQTYDQAPRLGLLPRQEGSR